MEIIINMILLVSLVSNDKNTSARACGEFDFWRRKFNRTVKRGERGIPIYKNYGEYGKSNLHL